jgi:Metallo-peptidase family M12
MRSILSKTLLQLLALVIFYNLSIAQENLFSSINSTSQERTASANVSAVKSKHLVAVNSKAITESFKFNTPNGKSFLANIESKTNLKTSLGFETNTYNGRINSSSSSGKSNGDFQISVTKGAGTEAIGGHFRTSDGELYMLKKSPNSSEYELTELDENKQIDCGGSASSVKNLSFSKASTKRSDISATAVNIRILVAYTTDAVTAAGGEAAIQTLISNLITYTNTAHSNSETGVTFTLAGMYALSSASTDNFSTDLTAATEPADGVWDDLHTVRTQYCADMVAVLIGGTQGQTICGLAWLGGNATNMPQYSGQMFSVTSVNQDICSYLTFTHELGHNLGSDHDAANSGGAPAYTYSYGYRFTGNSTQYRTVMAYQPGTRIPYFSNPRLTYEGAALGVAGQADNAQSISLTAPVVSTFYSEDSSCATDTSPTPAPTPAPLAPATIDLVGSIKGTKVIFEALVKDSYSSVVASDNVTLYYDKRKTGTFTKVVKTGVTNANGVKKFRITQKTGYYRVVDNAGITSNLVRVRVRRR